MSYSPVYSQPFILYTDATPNTEFLVPAGFTAVLRDVVMFCTLGGAAGNVQIFSPGSGEGIVIAALNFGGVNVTAEWHGRAVALENSTIALAFTGVDTSFTCYAGGYLLRNTLT